MFKYTPFFKVLEHIMDVRIESDIKLNIDDKVSVGLGREGLQLTYHRIYDGEDSGEMLSFNMAHCDDESIVNAASEDKPFVFNNMMQNIDSAESREKYILFAIFKEKMIFNFMKFKSVIENFKNKKKGKKELSEIKSQINLEFDKFVDVVNMNYLDIFPRGWDEFEDCEEVQLAEAMREEEISDGDQLFQDEYTIRMRFI